MGKISGTRRKLLASLGAGAIVGVAGCQSTIDRHLTPSPHDPSTRSPSDEEETPASRSDGVTSEEFTAETIEDFSAISQWQAITGAIKRDNSPHGKALRVRGDLKKGSSLWIRKKDINWDLKNQNLSFGLNINKPKLGQKVSITMRLHAPDAKNSITLGEFVRVLPTQGWFRIDAGPQKTSGNPNLSKVTAVDVMIQPPEGGETDVLLSDIRAVNGFDRGYIALTFDDSLQSQYKAHKVLKEHSIPGTLAVITGKIGKEGYLNKMQLKEMQNAHWDFAAHSSGETPVTELSTSAMEQAISDSHSWMIDNGFEKKNSENSFVYPRGRWDDESIECLKEQFNSGYRYLGHRGTMTGPITDPWTISRGDGTAGIEYIRPQIDMASAFNELMIFAFHDVGTGSMMSISEKELKQIITHGKRRGMKFITLSDIEERMMARMP